MKSILATRFIQIKKEWKGLVFWLLLPLVLTFLWLKIISILDEESKVPIALVVEEKSNLSNALIENISKTPYLHIYFLGIGDALHKLEKHELDSVFVIRKGYEENIHHNHRLQLIEAYYSNQSLAYFAVMDTISSFAQYDITRSKAALKVKEIQQTYGAEKTSEWEEIVQTSRTFQEKEELLKTEYTYQQSNYVVEKENSTLIKTWGIWAFFSIITTFFIFDWILKESGKAVRIRWVYTIIPFEKYVIINFIFYTIALVLIDALTYLMLDKSISFASIFVFRIIINLSAFLLAILYNNTFSYYICSIAIALFFTLIGGAFIPIEGLVNHWPWIKFISPVHYLLNKEIAWHWFVILIGLTILWGRKGAKVDA